MHQALNEAMSICKTLMRNGYDAHVINAPLQERLLERTGMKATLTGTARKGKIVLQYSSLEELSRLSELLGLIQDE